MEQKVEGSSSREWQVVGALIGRDVSDLGLCEVSGGVPYLFRVTALSDAGATTLLYRLALPLQATQGELTGNSR